MFSVWVLEGRSTVACYDCKNVTAEDGLVLLHDAVRVTSDGKFGNPLMVYVMSGRVEYRQIEE